MQCRWGFINQLISCRQSEGKARRWPGNARGSFVDDAAEIVCEVDSPFAAGLGRALESVRGENGMSAVISWLSSYRSEELRSGQLVSERTERFKKVNDAFASFHRSYRISMSYRAERAAREYLRGMEAALSKIIAIDDGMTEDAEELRAMLRSRDLDPLSERLAALATADEESATRRYLEGYEHRLLDNGFLMEELDRILAVEYNSRADGGRARLADRAATLGETTERVGRQVEEIDFSIEELSRDESVTADDRRVLLQSFVRRRSELSKTLKAVEEKALIVSALLAEYRSVTARLSEYLSGLRGQLARLGARRNYLRRLRSAGSEAPKLATILDEARDSLLSNAAVLQEAFLLLDDGFQNELIAALDSERAIGSVAVRLKEVPGVAFVFSSGSSVEAPPLAPETATPAGPDPPNDPNRHATRALQHSRRSIRPVGDPTARSHGDTQ